MAISIETTQRGFAFGEFEDRYGERCSIQKSSLAFEDCIWLGIHRPDGQDRMHLTQDQVADLLPLLQSFVETGELSSCDHLSVARKLEIAVEALRNIHRDCSPVASYTARAALEQMEMPLVPPAGTL